MTGPGYAPKPRTNDVTDRITAGRSVGTDPPLAAIAPSSSQDSCARSGLRIRIKGEKRDERLDNNRWRPGPRYQPLSLTARSARRTPLPSMGPSMGARGGSRSWVALLATALMFAPLEAIAGDPRPLTAHAGPELVAAGEWRPPSAGATIELSHINPLREEDADGEVYRTGCACRKHDVRGDRCARQARARRRAGDQRPGADRVPEAAAGVRCGCAWRRARRRCGWRRS